MKLKVIKMYEDVVIPSYATKGAACFDIRAYILPTAGNAVALLNTEIFETGLKFEIPDGYVMLVFSRSGHGFSKNVRLANCVGVIDSDYRGELKIKLTNDGSEMLPVRHGDRIAQGMLIKLPEVEFEEVLELSETDRGEGGFGSTAVA